MKPGHSCGFIFPMKGMDERINESFFFSDFFSKCIGEKILKGHVRGFMHHSFKSHCYKGGIGFFGFPVLVIFEIGFSVFALKISGFSVLVPTAVFGCSLFIYPVFGFY